MLPFALLQNRFPVGRNGHHPLLGVGLRGGVVFPGGDVDSVRQGSDGTSDPEHVGDGSDIQTGAAAPPWFTDVCVVS